MNSLTKTKTKTKKYWKLKTKLKRKNKKRNKTKTKKIQNENDNNADNSSMNAALRRLAVRAWNTHASACLWSGSISCSSNCPVLVPSQHLLVLVQETKLSNYAAEMCSGTVLNCTAIEFWQARKAEYPLLSKIAIDLISAPASQAYMLNACSANVATDGGQTEQNGKKTLNVAYLSEWTWSTFDNVNPVNGRECFILTADFNSDRYDSERMMMIMMTTTITSILPYCCC